MTATDTGVTPYPSDGTPKKWRAAVRVGKLRASKFFALDKKDAAIAYVVAKRAEFAKTIREFGDEQRQRGERRTVPLANADMDALLKVFMPSRAGKTTCGNEQSHLRGCLATVVNGVRIGSLQPGDLTSQHLKLMIASWQTQPTKRAVRRVRVAEYVRDGVTMPAHERAQPATSSSVVSARTIRYRLLILKALFRFFRTPLTPFYELVKGDLPRIPDPHPIGVHIDVVLQVARNLAKAAAPRALVHRYPTPELKAAAVAREQLRHADRLETYARYLVLTSTAQRPTQLMRTERRDVVAPDGTIVTDWLVRAAKRDPAHTIELTDDMASAMAVFVAADAFGEYDVSTHAKRVHAAGWPVGIRPNNARHSVVIDLLALDPDALAQVQALLGHVSPLTSQKFYGPLVASRKTKPLLQGRMAGHFKLREVKK